MSNGGRQLRGALGLSVIGGTVGGLLGAGWALLSGVLSYGWGFPPGNLVVGAVVWSSFGAFAAGGLGVGLALIGERITLDELPLWKAGLIGAIAGALFPPAILVMVGGSVLTLAFPLLASVSGLCAGLGGLLSFSLVAAAKHGADESLTRGGSRDRLEAGGASDA